MSDEQRTRVATHEAGHQAMAFMLGRPVGVSSIEPTEHYSGVAFHRPLGIPKGRFAPWLPVPMQSAVVRRSIEGRILVYLAGPAAEWWLAPVEPVSGYVPDDPDREAAIELARLAAPSPAETDDLARAARDPVRSDEVWAEELAVVFADDETAGAYLHWLEQETRRIVRSRRFAHLVAAIVPQLLEHTTLSGRLARRVLVAAEKEYNHGW
jgi:hypothetical protein